MPIYTDNMQHHTSMESLIYESSGKKAAEEYWESVMLMHDYPFKSSRNTERSSSEAGNCPYTDDAVAVSAF